MHLFSLYFPIASFLIGLITYIKTGNKRAFTLIFGGFLIFILTLFAAEEKEQEHNHLTDAGKEIAQAAYHCAMGAGHVIDNPAIAIGHAIEAGIALSNAVDQINALEEEMERDEEKRLGEKVSHFGEYVPAATHVPMHVNTNAEGYDNGSACGTWQNRD